MSNDEYRESVDIDFLVSDRPSYRDLRKLVATHGLSGLAHRELTLTRAVTMDQYGIRSAVLMAGTAIKFEIVHEGRVDLDVPSPRDAVCGVRTLTRSDQVASKLLANEDRWADTDTFSRDLIDLAMMRPTAHELRRGAEKAVDAYGESVGEALSRATQRLRERPERLDRCIEALSIDVPRASLWQAIRRLNAQCAKVETLSPPADSRNSRHRDSSASGRPERRRTSPRSNSGSFAPRQRSEAEDVDLAED